MRHYEPREYQRIAARFLLDTPRAMLAAPPGLGKTSTVLSVIDMLLLAGSNFFPVLVIAPTQVARSVWTNEVAKWDAFQDIRITRIMGTPQQRLDAMKSKRADVYVINYENLQWLITALGGKWPFKIVVADESTKLKAFRLNAGGKRSTTLSYVVQHTGRWINLSGTPAANGLQNLWGQFWFVDQGQRLGRTYTDFFNRYFIEGKYDRRVRMQDGAEAAIHSALADVMLSLRVEDWFPVMEPFRKRVEVDLPAAAIAQYAAMEKDFFAEVDAVGIEAVSAASKAGKLLQLASGFMYDTSTGKGHEIHDAKNEALQSIVDELNEPLLVVYWWRPDVARIQKAFPKARVYRGEKDRLDWNAGKVDMMLINPGAGGHGLDFQDGGRAIAHYSHQWDAELRLQVDERLGPVRQFQAGHNRAVLVYDIAARGTLDGEVLDRTESKVSVQEALMRARSRTR